MPMNVLATSISTTARHRPAARRDDSVTLSVIRPVVLDNVRRHLVRSRWWR